MVIMAFCVLFFIVFIKIKTGPKIDQMFPPSWACDGFGDSIEGSVPFADARVPNSCVV